MKTYVQDGHTIDVTNSGSAVIVSGTPVAVGDVLAVVVADIAVGGTGTGITSGVVHLPKLSTDNIPQGKTLNFKDGKVQIDATGATPAGKAWEAAAASSTMVAVRLNG
ncbi:MAG: capsid cement protein [Leclercia sp.]